MKKLLNYIFYGFYQIDYMFASPNDYFYHTRTGSLLFSLSIVSYIISLINLLSYFFVQLISKIIDTIEVWAAAIITFGVVIELFFGFYWFRDAIYVEDFRKLDKEPYYTKWVLF